MSVTRPPTTNEIELAFKQVAQSLVEAFIPVANAIRQLVIYDEQTTQSFEDIRQKLARYNRKQRHRKRYYRFIQRHYGN